MALVVVLQQPELYGLINSYYVWHLPPVQLTTAAVTVVEGLGRSSASVHEAALVGLAAVDFGRRNCSPAR